MDHQYLPKGEFIELNAEALDDAWLERQTAEPEASIGHGLACLAVRIESAVLAVSAAWVVVTIIQTIWK